LADTKPQKNVDSSEEQRQYRRHKSRGIVKEDKEYLKKREDRKNKLKSA
jgi:hypothetical protein